MEIIDNDAFWEEIKNVVMEKYVGKANKEDVYASLRKGYEDKFKTGQHSQAWHERNQYRNIRINTIPSVPEIQRTSAKFEARAVT